MADMDDWGAANLGMSAGYSAPMNISPVAGVGAGKGQPFMPAYYAPVAAAVMPHHCGCSRGTSTGTILVLFILLVIILRSCFHK